MITMTEKKLFLFVFSITLFFVLAQSAYSMKVYCPPPMIIVYADNYPDSMTSVTYYIKLENLNNFPVTIDITKSGDASSLLSITETNFVLQPSEVKNVNIVVNLNGPTYTSGLVLFSWSNGDESYSPCDMGIGIYGRSVPPSGKCGNSMVSCGQYPNCKNLYQEPVCVNGKHANYWCSVNEVKSNSYCDAPCCSLIGGTCQSGNCVVPQPPQKNITVNVTNGNIPRSVSIYLYTPGTSNLLNSANITGLGMVAYTNSTSDFKLEHDSKLSILLKNLNLDGITSTGNIILDSVSPTIPNVTLKRAYKISVPSSFSFTGITLTIKYSDLSVNENSLNLYRCGNYNLVTNTCNDTWIPKSMTKVNGFVIADLDSFSAYAIGESQTTTTTTTIPGATTTTVYSGGSSDGSGGGGGGGGGGSSGGSPTTTTIKTTTTLAPTTTTVPTTTTTQTNETVQQTQESPSILTGLATFVAGNPLLIGLPAAAATGIFLSWKFYFKSNSGMPSFNRRPQKINFKKRKSKETKLILQ